MRAIVHDAFSRAGSILDDAIQRSRNSEPIIILGNSLTRIASDCGERYRGRAGGGNISWGALVGHLLDAARIKSSTISFMRQGFSNAEIVTAAIDRLRASPDPLDHERAATAFGEFCEKLNRIKPLHLHAALPRLARIWTTNYDDLLDRGGRTALRLYPVPDSDIANGRIVHLHGYGAGPDWHRALDEVVLTSAQYQEFDGTTGRLAEEIQMLCELARKRVVIVVGLSLGIEETLVQKLLRESDSPAVIIEIAEPLAPLDRYRLRLGGRPVALIRGPLGSCAAPWRRLSFLTHAVDEFAMRADLDGGRGSSSLRNAIAEPHELAQLTLPANLRRDGPIASRVVVFGSVAWNTVCGVEAFLAEERFFDPKVGSLFPRDVQHLFPRHDRVGPRIADEMGGQGGATVLALDALGVASSIVSVVGEDETGFRILDRLQQADWINFEGVRQLSSRTVPSVARSTTTMCLAFYDVRQGINTQSVDAIDLKFALPPAAAGNNGEDRPAWPQWSRSIELDYTEIIYLCGSAAAPVSAWLQARRINRDEPDLLADRLLVMDTGTAGLALEAQDFVLESGGCVLASALAALQRSRPNLPRREHKNPALYDPKIHYDGEKWFKEVWQGAEMKDERARVLQLFALMKDIAFDLARITPPALARGKGAFVITLGSYGMLVLTDGAPFWIIDARAHDRLTSSADDSHAADIPASEIRNGLGCGDAARAGFVAALLGQARKDIQGIPRDALKRMVAAACFVGSLKIQYFRYEDFLTALRTVRDAVHKPTQDNSEVLVFGLPDSKYPASACMSFRVVEGDAVRVLAKRCAAKLKKLLIDRKAWEEEIRAWQAALAADGDVAKASPV
jgi:sugar/nucleoside kinase (ribokinase family)